MKRTLGRAESLLALKEAFRPKYLGLGLFWAWCYCFWFVPSLTSMSKIAVSETVLWYVCLAFAALLHFSVPVLLGKTRHLSSYPLLRVSPPLVMTLGSGLLMLAPSLSFNAIVCYVIAAFLGISSALLWNLWGEFYGSLKESSITRITPTFGVVLFVSLVVTFGGIGQSGPASCHAASYHVGSLLFPGKKVSRELEISNPFT